MQKILCYEIAVLKVLNCVWKMKYSTSNLIITDFKGKYQKQNHLAIAFVEEENHKKWWFAWNSCRIYTLTHFTNKAAKALATYHSNGLK